MVVQLSTKSPLENHRPPTIEIGIRRNLEFGSIQALTSLGETAFTATQIRAARFVANEQYTLGLE
jgi:hypothetical protein